MRKTMLFLMIPLLLVSCKHLGRTSIHAVVDSEYTGASGEMINGSARFSMIGEVLASVPEDNSKRFIIFIQEGRYHEKLSVDKPNVHFIGENRDKTIITFDAHGDTPSLDGKRLGTWECFTLQITAEGFLAENLTIENGFDYPANAAKSDDDHISSEGYARISSRNSEGERIWFDIEPDSRFFEFHSTGPGAFDSPSRPKLDENAAAWYIAANVLNGWQPDS